MWVCIYMKEETMQNTSKTLKGWYCSVAFASWIILMGPLLNSFGTNCRGSWPKCPLPQLWAKVSITLSPQSTPISFLAVPCAPLPAASLLVRGPSISLGEAISSLLHCGDIFLSQGASSASTAPGEVSGSHKKFYCDYVGVGVSIWVIAHLV